MSLPTWERGLKHSYMQVFLSSHPVAPYVGAWIETHYRQSYFLTEHVAPYVGAWIETNENYTDTWDGNVAPYVGAWIETGVTALYSHITITSLPTWERGLKQFDGIICFFNEVSLPTWERGLKLPTAMKR